MKLKCLTMKGDSFLWRQIQLIYSALINVKVPSSLLMKAVPSIGYDMSKNMLHVCYKYVDKPLSIVSQCIPFYLLK